MDNLISTIYADKTSLRLLLFLVLNLSFAVVELVYGLWANSLGLISDSFHMFFDSSALLAGLAASIIAQWEANEFYSFGYVRAEILAGFINGICLVFVAFFIFSEAIQRVLDPPVVKQERLLAVSIGGFLVNILGIIVFHQGHSHEPGSFSPSSIIMSQRHSFSESKHKENNIDHVPSNSSADTEGQSQRNLSRTSSEHEYTFTDPDTSQRNISAASDDPAPSTDPDTSQRDISHVSNDRELSANNGRDGRHIDDSHADLDAPDGLRHTSSGQAMSRARGRSVAIEDRFSLHSSASASEIIHGVYLHILADTLGSVGVIVSSSLISMFGWVIADPICSMFISGLIILSVIPLLHESGSILMQRTPVALDRLLPECYDKVSQIEGVYSIQQPHFWTLCTDHYVGTLKLEVDARADSQQIIDQTLIIFYEVGVQHMYVQIEQVSS
ncbi:hypothetical protein BsWGS_19622 [Bradybaena similaris]